MFPTIENANEKLEKICTENAERIYGNDAAAIQRLQWELDNVRKQGSASGYLVSYDALRYAKAELEDAQIRGVMISSLISYVLGFSDIDPLSVEPKLYPEFCFGMDGEKKPGFEFDVPSDIYRRLIEYFSNYKGADAATFKRDPNRKIYGVYIGEICDMQNPEVFFIDFIVIDKSKIKLERSFGRNMMELCKPVSWGDYAKCFGLSLSTGAWEGNEEEMMKEGRISLEDAIGNREDVYEFLLKYGIDKWKAFEIAEYVRMGKAHRKGWRSEDRELFANAGVPPWFTVACVRIKYLFPRAHSMAYCKRYCRRK